jgi:hypothetical protein
LNLPKTAESKKAQINLDKNKTPCDAPQTPESSFEHRKEAEIPKERPQTPTPNLEVTRDSALGFKVQVSKDKQATCSHYFGYLHTLQKASLIPNACYSCRRIMDCYCKGTDSGGTA